MKIASIRVQHTGTMGGNAGVNAATSNDTGSAGGGHTREDSVGRDPEELFCLKWNDYQENVVSTLSELRAEEDFFDVTLACDGEQVRAHKLVLSCCSLFFRRYIWIFDQLKYIFLENFLDI